MSVPCINCGRELRSYDRFCDACGRAQDKAYPDMTQLTQTATGESTRPEGMVTGSSSIVDQTSTAKHLQSLPQVRTEQLRLPPFTARLLTWSFTIGVIPPIALIAALWTKSLFLLDYVHVMSGGTWTGFDIFMGVVMTRIMRSLDIPHRVEVAKRLTPTTFFILPSLAATAITAGIYIAQWEGKFDLTSPWIIATGIVVVVLTAQGFGVFMPNGIRIFIELGKRNPDTAKIAKLNMRNIRLSASQAVFQVIIIIIMAHLSIY